jgi:hypothetical protein
MKRCESPEYHAGSAMKQRCYNPKRAGYNCYGGRGITVSDEWRYSFATFFADMGPRPEGMSLDRIDNDKGYSKDNCRWATQWQQTLNRRPYARWKKRAIKRSPTTSGDPRWDALMEALRKQRKQLLTTKCGQECVELGRQTTSRPWT